MCFLIRSSTQSAFELHVVADPCCCRPLLRYCPPPSTHVEAGMFSRSIAWNMHPRFCLNAVAISHRFCVRTAEVKQMTIHFDLKSPMRSPRPYRNASSTKGATDAAGTDRRADQDAGTLQVVPPLLLLQLLLVL